MTAWVISEAILRRFGISESVKELSKPGAAARLGKSDYERLAAFRYTLRRFLSFSEVAAHEIGLASQQYQALLEIRGFAGRDAITINDLAQRLLIKHNSAVGLVNRLEAVGLVRRQAAVGDRRKVDIVLTPKGGLAFERLAATHHAELTRIGPELRAFLDYVAPARRPGGRRKPAAIVRPKRATTRPARGA
jgi:DNA-binding MarR family transcriptional regulator